jgi:hypothetical protein
MNSRHNPDPASRRLFRAEHTRLLGEYYREGRATPGIGPRDRLLMAACRFTPFAYHLYNWVKWRLVRRNPDVRFGEIK